MPICRIQNSPELNRVNWYREWDEIANKYSRRKKWSERRQAEESMQTWNEKEKKYMYNHLMSDDAMFACCCNFSKFCTLFSQSLHFLFFPMLFPFCFCSMKFFQWPRLSDGKIFRAILVIFNRKQKKFHVIEKFLRWMRFGKRIDVCNYRWSKK